jgi:hypothetical protein
MAAGVAGMSPGRREGSSNGVTRACPRSSWLRRTRSPTGMFSLSGLEVYVNPL